MNEERLGEKCKSKNWKDRQEAYDRLGSIWEKSEECLGLLPLLQSETNIPALESAIDAILKARSPPRVEDVRKIFSHIGSMKTSTKSRVSRLVEFVSSKYPGEVVREMVRLVESKTPKTVLGAVGVLVEMGPKVDLEMVGECLGRILGHSDQGVRGEGMKLCVGLYKRHGERLKKYLKEMKPIQLKELEKKCEVKVEKTTVVKEDIPPSRSLPQRKPITPRSTPVKREKSTTCAISKPTCTKPTTTSKPTSNTPLLESFYSKYPFFKDKAWNSRLEEFRKNIPCLSKEDVRDLALFFYSHKEPIFQLTLAYMDLLLALDIRPVQDTLMAYCSEKVTETKLQGKIVEIFKRLDHGEGVEFLKKEIKSLKQGKKMVSLLWLLGEVTRPGDDLGDILSHPVVGINEKRALEQLRVKKCEVEDEVVENVECGKKDEVVENEVVDVPLVVEMPIVENKPIVENDPIVVNKPVVNNVPIVVNNVPLTISTPLTNTAPLNIPTPKKIPTPPVVELPKATLPPINPTQEMNILTLPFLKSFSRRPKGTGHLRDIFTPEFIRLMEGDDFPRVVDLFDSINKVVVSDFIIQYYVEKDLPSSFVNSLLLFFISERYILHESECLTLLRHLLEKDMKEELRMMDRVYPVTKLFFILQRIGTDESTNEILRLISKYRMFRGNKEKLVEELKKTNRQALKTAIRGCPDFLSFVDEIEGHLMTPRKSTSSRDRRGKDNKDGMIVPPSVLVDDKNIMMIDDKNITIVDDVDIESSLINITLKPTTSTTSLEDILDNLIDSDQEKSEMALKSLSELVKNDLDSILFSANSIVSSISIQLLDVLHRPLYASLILNVLLSLSRSPPFCQHLRVETLESLNSDLITMLKNKDLVQLVGDIITNLCLNSKPHISLQAYLSLFLKDKKDIPLKLIWRHSKNLKNVNLQEIVDIFETFYSKTLYSLEDPTTLKILTLHLKEIVFKYPGELEGLRLKGHTKRVVGLLKEKKEINPSELRK